MVVENYYEGKNANTLFHLRSISKNFTSALTGIAIEEGIIESADNIIKPYFPNIITDDKEDITIRHLLNMSSGLMWNEIKKLLTYLSIQLQIL